MTSDKIQIENAFTPDGRELNAVIESFKFNDNTTISFSELMEQKINTEGTEGDDVIFGSEMGYVSGGLGNDVISSSSGAETLTGGEGNDSLNANANAKYSNTLLGGRGDDELSLTLNGYIQDAVGSYFEGGQGNDTLAGSYGDDSYHFNVGDGQDIIKAVNGSDRITFGTGITLSNLRISRVDEDIVLTLLDSQGQITSDSITVLLGLADYTGNRIESIEFANGDSLSGDELVEAALIVEGTADDDVLEGTQFEDNIYGLGGMILSLYGVMVTMCQGALVMTE